MAAFNKFNLTVQYYVNGGNLNFTTDTCKFLLTNTAPVATNSTYSNISANELASGNGYTTGGASLSAPSSTNSSGTQTFTGTIANPTWSATGSMGPFRYVVLYDSTASGQPLIGWWDNGSSVTLNASQTFTLTLSTGILTIS